MIIDFKQDDYQRLISGIELARESANQVAEDFETLGAGTFTNEAWEYVKNAKWQDLSDYVNKQVTASILKKIPEAAGLIGAALIETEKMFDHLTKDWVNIVAANRSDFRHLTFAKGRLFIEDTTKERLKEGFQISVKSDAALKLFEQHKDIAQKLDVLIKGLRLQPYQLTSIITNIFELKGDTVEAKPIKYDMLVNN